MRTSLSQSHVLLSLQALLALSSVFPHTFIQGVDGATVTVVQTVLSYSDTGEVSTLPVGDSASAAATETSTPDNTKPYQWSVDSDGNTVYKPWLNVSELTNNCSSLLPLSQVESDAQCSIVDTSSIDITQYICMYASDGVLECTLESDLQSDCPNLIDRTSLNKSTHLKTSAALDMIKPHALNNHIIFVSTFLVIAAGMCFM